MLHLDVPLTQKLKLHVTGIIRPYALHPYLRASEIVLRGLAAELRVV